MQAGMVNVQAMDNLALREAVAYDRPEIVQALIDAGADVQVWSNAPLQIAAARGLMDLVALLLVNGADAHAVNDLAFRRAASAGHLDVLKVLLKGRASEHVLATCLLDAAWHGHLPVVRYIIEVIVSTCRLVDDAYLRNKQKP